jgi:uncharacterized protein (DUF3820 family)
MIKVTELISGQSFESMKFAADYFNIPMKIVTDTLKSNEVLEFNKKKYKFVQRSSKMELSSTIAAPITTFPFGKYKGEIIKECNDLEYIMWLKERDINQRLKTQLSARFQTLKELKIETNNC